MLSRARAGPADEAGLRAGVALRDRLNAGAED